MVFEKPAVETIYILEDDDIKPDIHTLADVVGANKANWLGSLGLDTKLTLREADKAELANLPGGQYNIHLTPRDLKRIKLWTELPKRGKEGLELIALRYLILVNRDERGQRVTIEKHPGDLITEAEYPRAEELLESSNRKPQQGLRPSVRVRKPGE